MYTPEHFRADDVEQCQGLMRANPFAILVGHDGEQGLVATHLPTVLKTEPAPLGALEAHMARANPHWKQFKDQSASALLIFSGPHDYIHPGWYPSKAEAGKVVPSWNYATVHAYGRIEIINDAEWLHQHVSELTDQQEAAFDDPWAVSDAPDDFVNVMMRGIVGFRFVITRLEGKRKMSQNRPAADREGVVAGLRELGTERAGAVADLVAEEGDKL